MENGKGISGEVELKGEGKLYSIFGLLNLEKREGLNWLEFLNLMS